MNLKIIFQSILISIIFLILVIFYFQYISKDKKISTSDMKKEKDATLIIDKNVANELINVEYNASDDQGNTFYLNSEKAEVEIEDNRPSNKVKLEKVVAILNIKNKGIINIYSSNAIYDKLNNNTSFFNDVKIEYLGNTIFSENLDIVFTEKISQIYNNVNFTNQNLKLNSDKILIDMISGDIKLEMFEKSDRIKLVTNYDLAY